MRIAYITTCFGAQSHTFIRREIAELAKQDIEVELFGIRRNVSCKLTENERQQVSRTYYLYPLRLGCTLLLNLDWMVTRLHRYWPALWVALTNGERKLLQRLKLIYHFFMAAPLAQQMEQRGVEHIHAHFMNVSATMAMYTSLLTGIPYSITVHSAGTRNVPHIIGISPKLKYAQFLIMISRFNIDYFDGIYPCRDKSTVVRCGIDLDQYPYREPDDSPIGVDAQPVLLLAVGRLVEKKGFRFLVDAVARLRDKSVDVALDIVGSGPLENALQQQVRDLSLTDRVTFSGSASTDDVRRKMLQATAVIVPSVTSESGEMEGIPVVLMEAMALGVPVLSTRHSGIPELVREDETGMVVPEQDVEALALALQSFSDTSSEKILERARYVRKARRLIESEFDIAVVARQRNNLFLQHRCSHQAQLEIEVDS